MTPEDPKPIQAATFEPLDPTQTSKKRATPWRRWMLYGAIGLFLIALAYLLTSRSLQISVVAEGEAQVSLSGLHIPLGGRYLLRPGSYQVLVTAPGYHPFDGSITVTKEDTQRQEIILQPLPGLLSIETIPPGASVLVDGEIAGSTPLTQHSIEAGAHSLLIQADRYLDLAQDISITGREVQQRLQLSLEPAWGDIQVNSQPAGATILVDEEPVGETPASVEILQGERRVSLQLPGYAREDRALTVEAGVAQDLGTITLTPATGVLSLSSKPSGANVSVNGEFAGQTPLDIELPPNRDHRISISKAGYRRSNESLRMEAGATESRRIALRPLLGDVVVKVQPEDAELLVNGKSVGRGSQTLSLPAVLQRIEFRREGFETVKRSVTPRAGLEQLVEVTLLTPEAARKARLKPLITTALGQTLALMNPVDSAKNEFSMGASRRDTGRRANEVLHPVRLERPFYIQTHEVTNAEFRQFTATHNSGQVEGNSLNREKQPAVQVSWQQAASFCNWLSQREGLAPFYLEQQGIIVGFNPQSLGYRLPSEAEWAWTARVHGETLKRFSWGEEFPPKEKVENIADNSSAYVTGRILNGYNDGYVVSAPVGSFAADERGIFDIGGNVSEWIHDVYTIPASSGVVQTDPLGGQRGDNYVIRGASWAMGRLPELRLSYRDYGQRGRDDVGFRIARYAE
ncbi:MAG: PEGA domain-containing protein [Congregibacter sp.]